MGEISTSLYWSLPGPQDFVGRVIDASRSARAIVLSLTNHAPNGLWHNVKRGLRDANIHEPVELTITEGMDVATEVGVHFNMVPMPGESLAHHSHGYQHAVILKAAGRHAKARCEAYAQAFVEALEHAAGDVRLILAIYDGEHRQDSSGGQFRIVAFDGMLNAAEMDAYITQRMVNTTGPGSTRLVKQLVTEYAGFDPVLAETLMGMDQSRILGLPESMTPLLDGNILRWSASSWVGGTVANCTSELHPLREWYIATHPGDQAAKSMRLADQRYWRACVRSLIPWLEERRPRIMEILDKPLGTLEQSHGGPGKISKKLGNKIVHVGRDDLEMNDLWHFFRGGFGIMSSQETDAISVCSAAKRVRDELAHLRRPLVGNIATLIQEMDRLVP
jgi:hypothetical protein